MSDPYPHFPRTGSYRTILADPPWAYRQKFKGGRGMCPYPPMTDEEIFGLPVGEAAAKDAILLLWFTNAKVDVALECVRNYGFQVKTILTWGKITKTGKPHAGTGFWLRGATEHAFFASRGRPISEQHRAVLGMSRARQIWSTLLLSPRREHSRKPDAAYAMLEQLSEAPRLELFARRRRQNWDTWGNHPIRATDTFLPMAQEVPAL